MIRINSPFAAKSHGVLVMQRKTWTLSVGGNSPKWSQVRIDPVLPFAENWRLFGDLCGAISSLSLILSPQYYDIVSCDAPTGSIPEWRQSLPFSLVDRTTYPPSDMTLLPWSVAEEWQTLVIQTSLLRLWTQALTQQGIVLQRAIPMHFLWSSMADGVLWSDEDTWYLSVFHHQNLLFQRQLRDFSSEMADAPIKLVQAIQQSEHFLRRQWDWALACEEDTSICPRDIEDLLSRSCVKLLVDAPNDAPLMAQMAWLVLSDRIHPKHWVATDWQIPQNPWSSWKKGALFASVIAVGLGSGALYWHFSTLERSIARLKTDNRQFMAEIKRQNDLPLKAQVAVLSRQVAHRQSDWQALSALDQLNQQGFSPWLTALGQSMTGEIQVTHFTLNGEHIELEGLAKHSDSVPAWIARFSQFPALKRLDLQGLTLNRDKDGRLTFLLTSEAT